MFDSRFPDGQAAPLYAPTSVDPVSAPYSNSIAVFDGEHGRRDVSRYGSDIMAEEHVFGPKRGSRKPGEGGLIGTLVDHGRGRSGIAILDAERVSDGPVAQAWIPDALPLGFHGAFAPAS